MNVAEVASPTVERVGSSFPEARRRSGLLTVSALLALTLVGGVLRILVAHQSLYADELATYWIITTRSLGSLVSTLYSTHAEITPPLSFVAFWVAAHLGHAPIVVRLPSLVAGVSLIPAIYLLGLKTVGRAAGLVAAGLATFSPFMIYYSTEARAYGLMMFFVTLSTLAMLCALDTHRARWWILYGACSCAAFYTHYTCIFVLAVQFLWVVWRQPEARRPVILTNLAVIVALLPWTGGFINGFNSPTTAILSALSPFNPLAVLRDLEGWAIGYPFIGLVGLTRLPGTVALVLLGLAVAVAAIGNTTERRQARPSGRRRRDSRVLLVAALALATPLGEAIISLITTHIFGVRNLAASWPALALSFGVLLMAAGLRLGLAAAVLAIASFVIGGVMMLEQRFQRPNYRAAADFISKNARPGDVVIDETGVSSPGPLTGLDVPLRRRIGIVRAGAPQERSHPFGFSDPIVPLWDAIPTAVALANGGRIFLVQSPLHSGAVAPSPRTSVLHGHFPAGYRLVRLQVYSGIVDTPVAVYARRFPRS